jgi:hypothetical protein
VASKRGKKVSDMVSRRSDGASEIASDAAPDSADMAGQE